MPILGGTLAPYAGTDFDIVNQSLQVQLPKLIGTVGGNNRFAIFPKDIFCFVNLNTAFNATTGMGGNTVDFIVPMNPYFRGPLWLTIYGNGGNFSSSGNVLNGIASLVSRNVYGVVFDPLGGPNFPQGEKVPGPGSDFNPSIVLNSKWQPMAPLIPPGLWYRIVTAA